MNDLSERAATGRRERKKLETRSALRDAATKLVAQHGLDNVTIEDITEAADVSLRTFFNYFPSKEKALAAPDPARLSRLQSTLSTRPALETPLEAVCAVLIAEIDQLSGRRTEWLQQLAVLRTDPRLLAALAESWWELEQAIAAGLERRLGEHQPPIADVLAATAVATYRVAIRRWNDTDTEPLAALVRQAFDTLESAIGGDSPATATRREEKP